MKKREYETSGFMKMIRECNHHDLSITRDIRNVRIGGHFFRTVSESRLVGDGKIDAIIVWGTEVDVEEERAR